MIRLFLARARARAAYRLTLTNFLPWPTSLPPLPTSSFSFLSRFICLLPKKTLPVRIGQRPFTLTSDVIAKKACFFCFP